MKIPKTEHIESCLICGHDLRGLTDEHGCPECGCPYERDAFVFREMPAPPRWCLLLGVAWIAAAGAGVIAVKHFPIARYYRHNIGDVVQSLLLVCFLVQYLAVHTSRRGGTARLVVSHRGVLQLQSRTQWQRFDWMTVGNARRVKFRTELLDFDGKVLLSCSSELLGGWRAARTFVLVVREHVSRALACQL